MGGTRRCEPAETTQGLGSGCALRRASRGTDRGREPPMGNRGTRQLRGESLGGWWEGRWVRCGASPPQATGRGVWTFPTGKSRCAAGGGGRRGGCEGKDRDRQRSVGKGGHAKTARPRRRNVGRTGCGLTENKPGGGGGDRLGGRVYTWNTTGGRNTESVGPLTNLRQTRWEGLRRQLPRRCACVIADPLAPLGFFWC